MTHPNLNLIDVQCKFHFTNNQISILFFSDYQFFCLFQPQYLINGKQAQCGRLRSTAPDFEEIRLVSPIVVSPPLSTKPKKTFSLKDMYSAPTGGKTGFGTMISQGGSCLGWGSRVSVETLFRDGMGRTSSSEVLVSSKVSSKSVLLSLDSWQELSTCFLSNPDAVGPAEFEFMGLGLGDTGRKLTDFLDTDNVFWRPSKASLKQI